MKLTVRLQVKPLSANKMYYRGKNKTREYLDYQNEIRDELIGVEWPFKDHPVSFHVNVGLSSPLADLDNVFKPFFDTLQAIYADFNDKKVYYICLLYTSPSPRDRTRSRMPSSA